MCALRIAVTGTAGRLGGSIARACRAAGQEVAATLDRAPGADVSHVADLSADGRHTWASAFEGVDVVIHAAALPGPAREPPPTVVGRDQLGTRNWSSSMALSASGSALSTASTKYM